MPSLKVTTSTFFKKSTAQAAKLAAQDKITVNKDTILNVKYAFKVGIHLFVELDTALATVGKTGYFFADHVETKNTELRGVWLTNVASDALFSKNNIEDALRSLKDLNINTLYPVVWNGNYTLYESRVADNAFGKEIHPKFAGRDIVQEILELALGEGFRVIPWFEYGLMTLPKSDLESKHPDWFTTDSRGSLIRKKKNGQGKLVDDEHIWLNPCKPEVIKFMTDLISEFVDKYPAIQGIQLDDHFGIPKEMGYDDFTKNLYKTEKGITTIPKSEMELGWANWVDWRVSKVTNLMQAIHTKVKSTNPDCLISLSPNPQQFSRANYMADWAAWDNESLIDELVVQIYRPTAKAVTDEITKSQSLLKARDRILTGIGLYTGTRGNSRNISLIKEQTNAVRNVKYAGFSYFFYETLIYEKSTPTKLARNSTDFDFLA
jgi:uncharacterized lipoprotein YddW (UPF0748 family)